MSGPADLDIFRVCYYIDNKTSNDFDAYLVKHGDEDRESRMHAPAGEKTKVSMLLGRDTSNCVRINNAHMRFDMWDDFHESFVGHHAINIVHNNQERLIHVSACTRLMVDEFLNVTIYDDHLDLYNCGWFWDSHLATLRW